jgi:hypothetical protein
MIGFVISNPQSNPQFPAQTGLRVKTPSDSRAEISSGDTISPTLNEKCAKTKQNVYSAGSFTFDLLLGTY